MHAFDGNFFRWKVFGILDGVCRCIHRTHAQATICDAFPLESDYESKIWHSLLITGIGLTAVATMLALNHR